MSTVLGHPLRCYSVSWSRIPSPRGRQAVECETAAAANPILVVSVGWEETEGLTSLQRPRARQGDAPGITALKGAVRLYRCGSLSGARAPQPFPNDLCASSRRQRVEGERARRKGVRLRSAAKGKPLKEALP